MGVVAYRLSQLIGRGESAEVWSALDGGGQTCAIKLIASAEASRVGLLDRLADEVALSRRLRHPGLVRLDDSGLLDNRPFLAMELIDGSTLKSAMAAGRLPLARSLVVTGAVAATLARLHQAGAIHRDVKPANIMLRGGIDAVLMDLGVAVLGATEREPGADLVGSPAYLAPEVIDDQAFDGKADVFALGVVLYMLVTGVRPFDGSVDEVMMKIRRDRPRPPSSIDPTLPIALDGIIADALEKFPACRMTAQELAAALVSISR